MPPPPSKHPQATERHAILFRNGRNQAVRIPRLADARWARVLATGETVPWDDAKAWLEARARGEKVARPDARSRPR